MRSWPFKHSSAPLVKAYFQMSSFPVVLPGSDCFRAALRQPVSCFRFIGYVEASLMQGGLVLLLGCSQLHQDLFAKLFSWHLPQVTRSGYSLVACSLVASAGGEGRQEVCNTAKMEYAYRCPAVPKALILLDFFPTIRLIFNIWKKKKSK